MKAWQIFWQSVLRVFNNLGAALRISGGPYIVIAGTSVVLILPILGYFGDRAAMTAAVQSGAFPWINFVIIVLVGLVGLLWIAVSWHRYILADEEPGILPAFHPDRIFAYLLRTLLIGLVMLVPVIVLGLVDTFVLSGLLRPEPNVASISLILVVMTLVFTLPLYVIGLRFSTALPAAALGEPNGIWDAWRATAGQLGTFVLLALILGVSSFLVDYVSSLLAGSWILSLIWSIVWGWISAMVGLSVLTTLYGHYVQGRALQ